MLFIMYSLYNRRKKKPYTAYVPGRILAEYKNLKLQNGQPVFGYSEYMMKSILERHTKAFFKQPKTWHAIRLTYLLNARKAGERLEVVASNMGLGVELLISYWHPTPEEMRRSVELIE